jgi:RES domain-containing protein
MSLAMVEYFVHIPPEDPPKDLVVVASDIPDAVSRVTLTPADLPPNWRELPAPVTLASYGDTFVAERKVAILIVPSAIATPESNWLINPLHAEFTEILVHPPEPFHFDPRFFG